MRSARGVFDIMALQWRKNMRRAQFWIVIIMVPLLAYRFMIPVVRFTRATGVNATPAGIAFFFSDYTLSMIMCIGLLLLFSQAPFMDEQMTYVLLRCDNRQWYLGSMLYCVTLAGFYVIYWLLCLLLPLAGNLEWSAEWGKIWNSLCKTTAYTEYKMRVKMPYILLSYRGIQALGLSVLLKLLFTIFISCIVFTWNIPWRIPVGSLATVALVLEDFFAMNGRGFIFYWYSPSTMSRLCMLDNTDTFIQPCTREASHVLAALVVLMILIGCAMISRTDINKRTQL